MLRKTGLARFAMALLLSMAFVASASARGGYVARGIHGAVYGGILGFGLGLGGGYYYGHPFDDGYDFPYGYGEYAEYGPWAGSNGYGGGCYVVRQRLWTAHGWRRRAVQLCD